jgi:hypothetical protein
VSMRITRPQTPRQYWKREHVDEMLKHALYVRHHVEMYWRTYNRPMRYRDIIPRMSQKLPKGVSLIDFVNFLQEQDYVHIVPVPEGSTTFVFPSLARSGISEDDAMAHVLEYQRTRREITRAKDRERKRRAKVRGLD